MCDCYDHNCHGANCRRTIPVHIGDYKYPREKLEAWCQHHLPKDRGGVEVFVMTKTYYDGEWTKRGTLFGLRLCGGTIRPSSKRVEINLTEAEPLEWTPLKAAPKAKARP